MTEPKKMDLKSMDIPDDKKEQLRQLFPEVFTEKKIDFEKLKLALGEAIENGKERYGLNWAGKTDCFKIIQQPSVGTLKPCREESLNFDDTENIFIEGDNLEVLKLLQKAYYGKVKMICFDPPYNTGNDFIYPDNYSESLDTYLKYTGQVDSEGRKYSTNTEADGRFHTKWINMMYPRLYLARNLLRDDGVMFISIDDNEVTNLRKICDEIFGEENFLAQIIVQSNKRGQTYKQISKTHEYVLAYVKHEEAEVYELEKTDDNNDLNLSDNLSAFNIRELRNRNPKYGKHNRPNLFYEYYVNPSIKDKDGFSPVSLTKVEGYTTEIVPLNSEGKESCWRWGKQLAGKNIHENTLISNVIAKEKRDGGFNIYEKYRKTTYKAKSIWTESEVITEQGTIELGKLDLSKYFDFPKPIGLIRKLISIGSDREGIILDFFAGSCTTAHAVMEQNKEDGGNRRFICIQLPEPIESNSEAFKAGFKTIADIGKERIRRAIQKLEKTDEGKLDLKEGKIDLGFKALKLDKSNFKIWETQSADDTKKLGEQLELHVDHIDPKSTQEDILYELLVKSGFDLATKTEKLTLAGKTVYSIADGAMLICLEEKLTKEVINAIAEMAPSRVICLDKGFKDNDQLKTNAVQIMKSKKVNTFLTV